MKQIAVALLGASLGFAAAWWILQPASTPARAPRPLGGLHSTPPAAATEQDGASDAAVPPLRYADIARGQTVFDQLFTAWQLAATSGAHQLEALTERALDEQDPLYDEVVAVFLERYTALDPGAAMAFVRANVRLDQATMQGHVLTSWARQDPERAFAYFQQIANPQIKIAVGARLLDDPTLAQSGLRDRITAELGPQGNRLRNQLEMRRTDPAELFESALTLNGYERQSRLNYAVTRWAQQDPAAALARLRELPNLDEQRSLMRVAITRYAQQNPQGALEYLQLNDPDNTALQAQILNVMARRWDVATALPGIEEFVSRTGQREPLNALLSSWAVQDPQGAIAYAESIDPDHRAEAYLSVAMGYVSQQPEEALNWALGLDKQYARVQQVTLSRVANQYPDMAEQLLTRVSDETSRSMIITTVARVRALSDPVGALDWLAQFRKEAGYAGAYRDALAQYARRDPEAAARMFEIANDTQSQTGLAGIIASAWYERDPGAATQWVLSLSENEERDGALSQLVGSMAGNDPDAAIDLADRMPAGDLRDRTFLLIAMAIVTRDPQRYDEVVARFKLPPPMIDQLRAFRDRAIRPLSR